MDFELDDDLLAFQSLALDFVRDNLVQHAGQWDAESFFPKDTFRKAASLGLATMFVREEFGGSACTRLQAAVVFEALATGCISFSTYLSIHNMVAGVIDKYGSDTLRQRFLPKLASMDFFSSYCLTEPNSGSDAASLKTRAVRDGDHFIVNGSKAFISGGGVSDVYLCMVRTGDDSHRGISALLIENGMPGLSFGKQEKKMGWKSQPTSTVQFDNVRVPLQNLVGEEGKGFNIALNALNGGRINIAAASLGGAKACLDYSKAYLHSRIQFGEPLSKKQALRFYFADMLTEYTAAKMMVYRAASALDKADPNAASLSAMAKRYATDAGFAISDKAMQLHGGYGYLHEYPIERIFRDLRVHCILEGTNEIMREIIARNELDNDSNLF